MFTIDQTEKLMREDTRLLTAILCCALNQEAIFSALVAAASAHHAQEVGYRAKCDALFQLLNAHVHTHAKDATELSNIVALLQQPAASQRDH